MQMRRRLSLLAMAAVSLLFPSAPLLAADPSAMFNAGGRTRLRNLMACPVTPQAWRAAGPTVWVSRRARSRHSLGRRQGDERGGLRFGAGALHLEMPFPNLVDRRVDDELEGERCEDAA